MQELLKHEMLIMQCMHVGQLLCAVQALVKVLDDVSNEEIRSLEIPTGVPLVYELDDAMKAIRHYHVGCAPMQIFSLIHALVLKALIYSLTHSVTHLFDSPSQTSSHLHNHSLGWNFPSCSMLTAA